MPPQQPLEQQNIMPKKSKTPIVIGILAVLIILALCVAFFKKENSRVINTNTVTPTDQTQDRTQDTMATTQIFTLNPGLSFGYSSMATVSASQGGSNMYFVSRTSNPWDDKNLESISFIDPLLSNFDATSSGSYKFLKKQNFGNNTFDVYTSTQRGSNGMYGQVYLLKNQNKAILIVASHDTTLPMYIDLASVKFN